MVRRIISPTNARVGQQGTLTRVWAKRDTRYEWSYIFGAVCPGRTVAAALALPYVNTVAPLGRLLCNRLPGNG